jgi:hypothetical protein
MPNKEANYSEIFIKIGPNFIYLEAKFFTGNRFYGI